MPATVGSDVKACLWKKTWAVARRDACRTRLYVLFQKATAYRLRNKLENCLVILAHLLTVSGPGINNSKKSIVLIAGSTRSSEIRSQFTQD